MRNVHCKVADAEDLQLQGQLFDAAICRLGLMFCPNVAAALTQVRASLRPHGRFSVIVFGEPTTQDYVVFIRSAASPILQIIDGLSADVEHQVWRDLTDRLTIFQQHSGWEGPNELLLCCGVAA